MHRLWNAAQSVQNTRRRLVMLRFLNGIVCLYMYQHEPTTQEMADSRVFITKLEAVSL